MDVKDSYLHGTVGVVKSINVTADKLIYKLADINNTSREVPLPLATTATNGLLSSSDYKKLRSTTLAGYGITDAFTWRRVISSTTTDDTSLWGEIGIQTYGEVLPDGLTDQYTYGVLTSFNNNKGGGPQFQLYASDYRGDGSINRRHIAWRTGFGANKGVWQQLANINTENIFTEIQTFQKQIKSTVATGTAPFTVASTTLVTNLNADMVDGYNSTTLFTCESGYAIDVNAPHPNKKSGTLLYKISANCSNIPPNCTDGVLVHFNRPETDTAFQLASNYSNTGLYYRSGVISESSSYYLYNKAWKTFAFTDSNITGNAATATKLQTARKIWGQSFNGTADVTGNLTIGANSIVGYKGTAIFSDYGNGNVIINANAKDDDTLGGIYLGYVNTSFVRFGSSSEEWGMLNKNKFTITGTVTAPTFQGNLDGSYINKLTGYTKATTISAITATDTLNTALGKLEAKADQGVLAYKWYQSVTLDDTDDIINKWDEVVDFVNHMSNDLTDEFVTRKTELTIIGAKTFSGTTTTILTVDRNHDSPTYIAFRNKNALKGYLGIDSSENPVYTNTNGNVYNILHAGNYTNYKHSYTNLTGSTTIANQAIVSNGTKNGWKLLTLRPGAFLDDYPMLTLGTLSDYVEYVLLLHPIAKRNSNDNWIYYYSYGTIYTHRSNGLDPSSSITYNSIPKYDKSGPTKVYVSMVLQGKKYALWCTCTYNGLKYCGLKLYTPANNSANLTIKGRWNSDPVLVKYKTNQKTDSNGNITSEEIIHNEEIANSIVVEGDDIIINYTHGEFKGTFKGNITGGTVGSVLYQSTADITSFLNPPSTESILTSNGGVPYWTSLASVRGYIGTTAVQSTSANQALTGITSLNMSENINILSGNSDRYITFGYSNNAFTSADAYSWRLGYIGSGEDNANYFKIQSSHGNIWTDVLKLGLLTYEATFSGNVIASRNIILQNSSGSAATPYLYFKRNNNNDAYIDWRLGSNNIGKLIFQYNYNESNATTETWNDVFVITRTISTFNSALEVTGNITAPKFIGSASKLTSNTIVNNSKAFNLSSAEWVDTGYTFTNLATGTYAVQVTSETNLVASGIMSIYLNLEDTKGDEIPLHVYRTTNWRPYLRTYKNKLLISSNDTSSTSRTVTIKIALIL